MRTRKVSEKYKRKVNKKGLSKRLLKSKKTYHGDFPLKKNRMFSNLNERQKEFIYNIYLRPITKDTQTECYAKAYGIDLTDYKKRNNCAVKASMLLKKVKFVKMLQIIQDHHSDALEIDANRLIEEETLIAYSNIMDYVDEEGYVTANPNTLPERIQRAIKKFEQVLFYDARGNEVKKWKIELWDKQSSLRQLQKLSGIDKGTNLNVKSHNVNVNINKDVKKITEETSAKEAAQIYAEMIKGIN